MRNLNRKPIALLLSVLLLILVTVGTTFALFMSKTDTFLNTFFSGVKIGDVTVSKTLDYSSLGNGYVLPNGLEYTFTVELGDAYANARVNTDRGGLFYTADADGKFELQLAPGASVTLVGLDEGTAVKVTETLPNSGYLAQQPQTATVLANDTVTVLFENVYTPAAAPNDLTLTGEKVLEGRDWLENDSFTFLLEQMVDGVWTELGRDSADYADHTFDFTAQLQGIALDRVGTYQLRVSEVEGSLGGVTYDDDYSYLDVLVGDADMDGALEIQSVTSTSANVAVNGHSTHVTVKNEYAPFGSDDVTVAINKTLDDRSGRNLQPAGFTFELYDGADLVKTSAATSAAGETSIKLVFTQDEIGEHVYTLKETNAGQTANGMTYDATEYAVKVSVVDNLDGTVSASITEGASCSFANVYDPADDTVTLDGSVTLDGRNMNAGEFAFQIYETDSSFTVDGSAAPKDTQTNAADGSFTFHELAFDQVGTYYFVVLQDTSAELGGVIYDTTRYNLTVSVTDENGTLVAAVTDVQGNPPANVFENRYVPDPVALTLTATKQLTGATLSGDRFAFLLSEADDQFNAVDEIEAVRNASDGSITFTKLTFDEVGTYYYLITEDTSAAEARVTYDESVYAITVEVADDLNGKLVETHTVTKLGEGSVNEMLFTNVYTPRPDDLTLDVSVHKTIQSKEKNPIGPEGFIFVLQALDENGEFIQTSDANGNAKFTLTFSEEDVGNTYHYQITEYNDGRTNVTYSTEVYQFEVTVSLGADNKLKLELVEDGKQVDSLKAEFVNIFSVKPVINPETPNTGDNSFAAVATAVMMCAAIAFVVLSKRKRA